MADDEKPATSERCRACYYCGYLDTHDCTGPRCCDYFLVTGQRRGCPAGDGCTRFRPGPRPKTFLRRKYHNFELEQ